MNAAPPHVTVVIPYYRGRKFIADAVASVLSQEDGTVEVVIVDDGSDDDAAAAVAGIADPRVRVLHHEGNRGIAAARNTGLNAARADLIAFLDQDDVWLPGRLSSQLQAFAIDRAGDVALVFGGMDVVDRNGRSRAVPPRVPRDLPALSGTKLLARLVADNFVPLGASMIRRRCLAAVGPFDESIRGGSDDFDMITRLAERGRFVFVPQRGFARRLHDDNYTRAERMIAESLQVIDRVEHRHPEVARAARVGRGRRLYRRARDVQATGNVRDAARDYRAAIAAWPWQARAWLGLALCGLGPVGNAVTKGRRRRG
jgi:glycosyltransferase involved in cell wall biosynthesis